MPVGRIQQAEHGDELRRLLLLAYAFPPTGGPGVQRPAKFAKYLPRWGWRPVVWTVDQVDGLPLDYTLGSDLPPEVKVHARGSSCLVRAVRRSLRSMVESPKPAGLRRWTSHVAAAVDWRMEAWQLSRTAASASEFWARRSIRPLCRLIVDQRIDAIFSTFSPIANHVLALELKRRSGLPWVADFRDLWTEDYRYSETSPEQRAADRKLEQEILESADAVVGVTDRQTAILAEHVPSARHKFVTITNGFDPADFAETPVSLKAEVPSSSLSKRFVLACVGRLDRYRSHGAWLAGLGRFADSLGPERRRFVLRIVGHANSQTRRELMAAGIDCEFTSYVSHGEAVAEMRRADALLLSAPSGVNADSTIPGKLFEYLASGRPILLIGPSRGVCESFIASSEAGLVVDFDETAIAEALRRLYAAWGEGRPMTGCRREAIEQYSRIELTRRLAGVLNGLVARQAGQPETREAFAGAAIL